MAHTHEHEHTHEHGHTHEVHSPEETVALLTYMVGHNQHHAEEPTSWHTAWRARRSSCSTRRWWS